MNLVIFTTFLFAFFTLTHQEQKGFFRSQKLEELFSRCDDCDENIEGHPFPDCTCDVENQKVIENGHFCCKKKEADNAMRDWMNDEYYEDEIQDYDV